MRSKNGQRQQKFAGNQEVIALIAKLDYQPAAAR